MNIVVIDGQGGKLGAQIVKTVCGQFVEHSLTAVGTNSIATAQMLKAGAVRCATGENAIKVACARADVIIGPIGIVIADSMLGEVTPNMALYVSQSHAKRLLIPMNMCDNIVVGIDSVSPKDMLSDVTQKLRVIADEIGRCTCS